MDLSCEPDECRDEEVVIAGVEEEGTGLAPLAGRAAAAGLVGGRFAAPLGRPAVKCTSLGPSEGVDSSMDPTSAVGASEVAEGSPDSVMAGVETLFEGEELLLVDETLFDGDEFVGALVVVFVEPLVDEPRGDADG